MIGHELNLHLDRFFAFLLQLAEQSLNIIKHQLFLSHQSSPLFVRKVIQQRLFLIDQVVSRQLAVGGRRLFRVEFEAD